MALVSKSTQYYSGFDPRFIPGCRIWLDAADTNTITPSTGTVTQWNDKSGNGFNLVAASGGPTTASGTLNGLNVISNSGSQQMSNLSATVPSHEHAFFAVTRPTTITGYPQGNTRVISFQNTGYIVFPFMAPGPVPRGYINSSGGAATAFNGSTLVENSVAGSYSIICANIASGSQQIFRNGTLQSSCNATITVGTSDAAFYVGGNGGGDNFQGNIAEIIIYNRQVSSDERQQVEAYLAWKWGLSANLPTTTPYKSIVPATRFPNPTDLGPMLFWWDSAAYSTISVSSGTVGAGGTVSSWNDRINNVALTVPSGLVGPSSTANGVSFTNTSATITNGVSQVLRYFNASSPWKMTQPMTMIVACAPNRFDANRSPFFLQAPAAFNVNPSYWLAVCMSSSEGNVVGAYNGSTAWLSLQQSAGTLTTAGAGRVDSLLSASSNFTWTNGTENAYGVNNIGRGTTVSSTGTITGMVIGGTATFGGNRAFDGLVYEILVYNSSLPVSAIRQAEGYLAWKWKFQSSLASTHPYRNYPTMLTVPYVSQTVPNISILNSSPFFTIYNTNGLIQSTTPGGGYTDVTAYKAASALAPTGNPATAFMTNAATAIVYNQDGTYATTVNTSTSGQIYVTNYGTNGKVAWVAYFTSAGTMLSSILRTDGSGNVYLIGTYDATLSVYSAGGSLFTTLTNAGGTDVFIVKYNTSGVVQWATRISGTGNETANGMNVDSVGNVHVTGTYTASTIIYYTNGTTFKTFTNSGSTDVFIVKYDTTGTPLWGANITGTGAEGVSAITTDTAGNVYILGRIPSAGTNINNASGTLFKAVGPLGGGTANLIVVKYNSSGVAQTENRIAWSGGTTANGTAISINSSGTIYVAGSSDGTSMSVYASTGTLSGSFNSPLLSGTFVFYIIITSSNTYSSVRTIGNTGSGSPRIPSLQIGSSGAIYASGSYNTNYILTFYDSAGSAVYTIPAASAGTGYYTVKYNTGSTLLWVARGMATGTVNNTNGGITDMTIDSSENVCISGALTAGSATFYSQGQ